MFTNHCVFEYVCVVSECICKCMSDSLLSQWLGFVKVCGFCVCELTAIWTVQWKYSTVTAYSFYPLLALTLTCIHAHIHKDFQLDSVWLRKRVSLFCTQCQDSHSWSVSRTPLCVVKSTRKFWWEPVLLSSDMVVVSRVGPWDAYENIGKLTNGNLGKFAPNNKAVVCLF